MELAGNLVVPFEQRALEPTDTGVNVEVPSVVVGALALLDGGDEVVQQDLEGALGLHVAVSGVLHVACSDATRYKAPRVWGHRPASGHCVTVARALRPHISRAARCG
jgi:hypothetical protein